jgi:hypothetical protein
MHVYPADNSLHNAIGFGFLMMKAMEDCGADKVDIARSVSLSVVAVRN